MLQNEKGILDVFVTRLGWLFFLFSSVSNLGFQSWQIESGFLFLFRLVDENRITVGSVWYSSFSVGAKYGKIDSLC